MKQAPRPFRVRPLVFSLWPLSVAAALASDPPVDSPEAFRTLLRAEQVAALPSAVAVTQEVGSVSLDPATTADAAFFAPLGSGPSLAFEDAATRDTVLTNPATGGAARLPAEDDYDPEWIARQVDGLTEAQIEDVAPFYDPALVTVSFSFSPTNATDGGGSAPDPASLSSGLLAAFYRLDETLSTLPDLSARSVSLWTSVPAVAFPNTAAAWTCADERFRDLFAVRLTGFLSVEEAGDYSFALSSDDGSVLFLDGAPVVSRPDLHVYSTSYGSVHLAAGLHPLRIDYFENTGTAGLSLSWARGDDPYSPVPASVFFHEPPAFHAPGVALAAPEPARCFEGNLVSLAADPWAFGGAAVARVDFFARGTLVATATNAPFAATWLAAGPGEAALSAVVTDDAGRASPPAVRTLEILPCPAGYAPGVASDYYALSAKPGALPDFSALVPALSRIEAQIDHREGAPWPGVACSAGKLFASRHVGALFAPATGDYTLFLESAEVAVLRLDGEPVLSDTALHTRRTVSATVRLAYGFHTLEILHLDQGAPPTLRLQWRGESFPFATVPQTALFHPVGNPDADGDGMEDWWEDEFGFDPSDPSDAAPDPDSDGLSNLAEFRAGTDPHLADTDGDGIPDEWEVRHGLNPCAASDAAFDPDGDGLNNLAEFHADTNPGSADTDGDGVPDAVEVLVLHGNPLVADFDGSLETIDSIPRERFAESVAAGAWSIGDDGSAVLLDRAGVLSFSDVLPAPQGGVNRLRVRGTGFRTGTGSLRAEWDGLLLPLSECRTDTNGTFVAFFDPPATGAGAHTLSLSLHNVFNAAATSVSTVELVRPGGTGWQNARAAFSRTDVTGAVSSKVSPFCLRGTAPSADSVSIVPAATVKPLPAHGWWADVPLRADAATAVEVGFEPGAVPSWLSVSWSPFLVLSDDPFPLRAGESLLFQGVPDASVFLSVPGVTNVVLSPGEPIPVRFPDAGEFEVFAFSDAAGTDLLRSFAFRVERADLDGGVPAWKGRADAWRLHGSFLGDAFVATEDDLVPTAISRTADGLSVSVFVPDFDGARAVSVELPDGRVLDSAPVQGFKAFYSVEPTYHVKRRLPDGTRTADVTLRTFDMPPSVSLEMRAYNAGLCFENGASSMTFERPDFGWSGERTYTIFVTPFLSNPCQYPQKTTRVIHTGGN